MIADKSLDGYANQGLHIVISFALVVISGFLFPYYFSPEVFDDRVLWFGLFQLLPIGVNIALVVFTLATRLGMSGQIATVWGYLGVFILALGAASYFFSFLPGAILVATGQGLEDTYRFHSAGGIGVALVYHLGTLFFWTERFGDAKGYNKKPGGSVLDEPVEEK